MLRKSCAAEFHGTLSIATSKTEVFVRQFLSGRPSADLFCPLLLLPARPLYLWAGMFYRWRASIHD